ncbi:MAG TPA: HD domain-containing protein [Candidatus Paceibacterota bacterium]
MNFKIVIPKDVNIILKKLKDNGFMGYIVGGCVRDNLLNKTPKDWDICTNALPDQMIMLFSEFKVIPTGLKHGTLTIVINDENYEVTTFRIDGDYSDNRRPDEVTFTNSLIEDLSRRDFTINAMAFNYDEGLIDPFFGMGDIVLKTIKCVGNPNNRFQEDALRMLRAVRFQAQLGFNIEKLTHDAIHYNSELIKNVSAERISQEINKILMSNPLDMYTVNYYKLLKYHLPELDICFWTNQDNPYHCFSVGKHLTNSANFIEKTLYLRLTMLLHDVAKPQCKTVDENGIGHFYGHAEVSSELSEQILRKLKYDNDTILKVKELILYHDMEISDSRKSVKKLLNKIGEESFRDLLKVKEADIKAQNLEYYQDRCDKLEKIKLILEDVLITKECFDKKDLAINGNDLIQIGFKQGKEIGDVINRLVEMVIENPELNNKNELLKLV